jgi:hypothetical protein
MRWAGHVAGMEEMKPAYKMLVGTEGKRPLGRTRCRWYNNIKPTMDLKEITLEGADSSNMA